MTDQVIYSLDRDSLRMFQFSHTPPPGGMGLNWREGKMNQDKDKILNRLRSIEGHVRGVMKMVEDGAYCIDVVNQINAVQAALQKINTLVLDKHLHTCVTTAIRGDDLGERERVIDEIIQVYNARAKN